MRVGKCSVCGSIEPLGIDDRCNRCLEDKPIVCENCGDVLNDKEIEYNKDADYPLCFPCMKGN